MPKFSTLKISRSGLKLFQECPRCFWLDVHHKIKRPPSLPPSISMAIDFLVKQEFDKYREAGTLPPVLARHGIRAKLYNGLELRTWRENFKGVQYFDEDLNALLYGAVDDILQFEDKSLAVVDYKSTGSHEIKIYTDYQKQMEVYSWLLSRNGFATYPDAFFVFYHVDKTGGGFLNTLPFHEVLKAVKLDTSWVSGVFEQAVEVARRDTPPEIFLPCPFCIYVQQVSRFNTPVAAPAPSKTAKPKAAKKPLTDGDEPIIRVD